MQFNRSFRTDDFAPRATGVALLEVIVAVAAATAGVAALQSLTPAAGLGVLYLLAVLAIAIRRGRCGRFSHGGRIVLQFGAGRGTSFASAFR
jgi:K+-sensing histidine kinase KdpD